MEKRVMSNISISNDRIKHRYFQYLKDAQGHDEATIDAVAKSLVRFEAYTKKRNFKQFHIEQASGFKHYLADQQNSRTGKPLSKSTIYATLAHLKRFFLWLAGQPGYRSRIHYADAQYFSPSEKDARVATARREPHAPTLDQVKHAVTQMPSNTAIERRDRALIAFIAITGARDRAVASLKLRHVDLSEGCVRQDGRDVQTKFAKTFDTWFFPIWNEGRAIVEDWLQYLRVELLLGNDDPIFPATRVDLDRNGSFATTGLSKDHWHGTGSIRKTFRSAFGKAGLDYFNPHSFRHMLVRLAEKHCRTPEEFKAWSQNLGHERVMTTFINYGPVSPWRQAEIMRGL
jgi:integrase